MSGYPLCNEAVSGLSIQQRGVLSVQFVFRLSRVLSGCPLGTRLELVSDVDQLTVACLQLLVSVISLCAHLGFNACNFVL